VACQIGRGGTGLLYNWLIQQHITEPYINLETFDYFEGSSIPQVEIVARMLLKAFNGLHLQERIETNGPLWKGGKNFCHFTSFTPFNSFYGDRHKGITTRAFHKLLPGIV